MRKTIDNKLAVCASLARLCDTIYCRGIRDAADMGDELSVRNFLDSHDQQAQYAFMFDHDGRLLKMEMYAAIMAVECGVLRAKAAAILFTPIKCPRNLIHGACALVNSFYRLGLEDGIGATVSEAKSFMMERTIKGKLYRKFRGEARKRSDMIAEMQYQAAMLDSLGFKPGFTMYRFFNAAFEEQRLRGAFIYDEPE
jgi:hypothetical protein